MKSIFEIVTELVAANLVHRWERFERLLSKLLLIVSPSCLTTQSTNQFYIQELRPQSLIDSFYHIKREQFAETGKYNIYIGEQFDSNFLCF